MVHDDCDPPQLSQVTTFSISLGLFSGNFLKGGKTMETHTHDQHRRISLRHLSWEVYVRRYLHAIHSFVRRA